MVAPGQGAKTPVPIAQSVAKPLPCMEPLIWLLMAPGLMLKLTGKALAGAAGVALLKITVFPRGLIVVPPLFDTLTMASGNHPPLLGLICGRPLVSTPNPPLPTGIVPRVVPASTMGLLTVPATPCGIPKFRIAALVVPLLVTVAEVPGASVVVVPTATVAAAPAGPGGPCGPVAPPPPKDGAAACKGAEISCTVPEMIRPVVSKQTGPVGGAGGPAVLEQTWKLHVPPVGRS